MKKLLTLLVLTGAFGAFAEEAAAPAETKAPEAAAPAEAKAPETKAPEAAAPAEATAPESKAPEAAAPAEAKPALREQGTDEIDLEEIDDSAEAAKKATVKQSADTQFVDITCDEATIADILRQFRKTTNANIISDDSTNLQQRVSVNLNHVHWLKGLESILNMKGFRLDEREGIFRVVEDRQLIPIFTRTFPLNHASAKELAQLFNKSYGNRDPKAKNPDIATAFMSANKVVVTGTEKQLAECESIIREVDIAVPQVYIEARFLELSSEALHKLGLKWDSLKEYGVHMGKLTDNPNNVAEIDARGMHTAGNMTEHNFTGTLTADSFSLALSAFEEIGGTQIFSNPKVIVSNGKQATIDMTTKYPNLRIDSKRTDSATYQGTDYTAELRKIEGREPNPAKDDPGSLFAGSCFFEWGITLTVKPRISPDKLVSVEIVPSISELDTDITRDGFYQVQGGSNSDQNKDEAAYGKFPIIKMKSITTEFTMKDGSTAVIGGLTRTVEEDIDNGIPFLRKIPWIGQWLFGWKSRQKVQKEIIVCVTLGIANPDELPEDIGLPTNAVYGREYVKGIRKEPGLRGRADNAVLRINTKPIHEREISSGEVLITPSVD